MGPDQEVHPFVLEGRQKTFESGEGKTYFPYRTEAIGQRPSKETQF